MQWFLADAIMADSTLGQLQVGRQATFCVDWTTGNVGRPVNVPSQKHTLIDIYSLADCTSSTWAETLYLYRPTSVSQNTQGKLTAKKLSI